MPSALKPTTTLPNEFESFEKSFHDTAFGQVGELGNDKKEKIKVGTGMMQGDLQPHRHVGSNPIQALDNIVNQYWNMVAINKAAFEANKSTGFSNSPFGLFTPEKPKEEKGPISTPSLTRKNDDK